MHREHELGADGEELVVERRVAPDHLGEVVTGGEHRSVRLTTTTTSVSSVNARSAASICSMSDRLSALRRSGRSSAIRVTRSW